MGDVNARAIAAGTRPALLGQSEEVLAIHSETRRILAEIQRLQEEARATPITNGVLSANQALTAQATAYTLQSGGSFNEDGAYSRSTLLVNDGANRLRQSSATSGSLLAQAAKPTTSAVGATASTGLGIKAISPVRRTPAGQIER